MQRLFQRVLAAVVLGVSSAMDTTPTGGDTGCTVLLSPTTAGCMSFDLSALPPGPFAVHDTFPMPYFVAPPCTNLTAAQTNCTSFNSGDSAGAPVYAVAGNPDDKCYALGHTPYTQATLLDSGHPEAGVLVELDGGVGGRVLQYAFSCDPSLPPSAGPTNATNSGFTYTIHWPTPLACHPTPTTGCGGPIPVPTPDQLAFQEMEFGALICYNMATAMGSQGCPAHSVPPISTFTDKAPADVDTDGWCQAIKSFGGQYATIVAKHVCGFAIWPTEATLPARNWSYAYHVPQELDIVAKFAASCKKVGVKLGIYYSVVSNEYLNVQGGMVRSPSTIRPGQVAVTQAEYGQIALQQLTELWTRYGDLAEIWFDGGFAVPSLEPSLLALLNRTQPHACIFNGCGLSPNAVAWIGTESGHAPYPVWNTQTGCPSGAGTPFGKQYVPKEVDLTLQNADTWFYREGTGYRSLAEMASIYHDSVGHGGNMLLNVAPPPNSTLPAVAVQRYRDLGAWVARCYGQGATAAATALATTSGPCANCSHLSLTVGGGKPVAMDRFLLKEDLTHGQLVLQFFISIDGVPVFNGTAIGRTLIALLGKNVTGQTVTLTVTEARAPPTLRLFAVPSPESCSLASGGDSCTYIQNTLYTGPVTASSKQPTAAACCGQCREVAACAFFTYYHGTCSLMTAQQGSTTQAGAVSGSPA